MVRRLSWIATLYSLFNHLQVLYIHRPTIDSGVRIDKAHLEALALAMISIVIGITSGPLLVALLPTLVLRISEVCLH